MSKIISYEDSYATERVHDDLDIKSMSIFKEASEKSNCKIMRDDNQIEIQEVER